MRKNLFLILFFIGYTHINAQNYNRPVPPALFPYQFNSYTNVQGYYFTSALKFNVAPNNPNFKSPSPAILDQDGYVYWYFDNNAGSNADFKYFENHSKISFTRDIIGVTEYFILDMNLNIIDSITNTANTSGDGHEFLILDNGNYMFIAAKDTVMDLSAYTFNGTQGSVTTTVKAAVIQEFDSSHNLVFEWNSIDHIFPTETYDVYGYNVNGFDYAHANAIDEDVDGNILVSFRHLDAIYKIDHTTGNVIWILGGRSSDFTFPNDVGFSGQHDGRRLPNGEISMFDNTNNHAPPHKSRGVSYALDTLAWTATRTWQYLYTPSFFARAMGNNQLQPNGNHLINYGLSFRPHPSFVLIDNGGNLLTETFYQDSVMNYRTHFYDVPFSVVQPQIICNGNGTTIDLTVPPGYTNYVWSTGETTSTITISQPDTIQVWVNYGSGMLGSVPLIISSMTDCAAGITSENINGEITLIRYIDLLGREVEYPINGQMYIAVYSNGIKRLKFIDK